jgi:citrate lyase gamma subunit
MPTNEEMDASEVLPSVLERVCLVCSQLAVDYFIECIRCNKQRIVYQALLCEGFKEKEADDFIETIEQFIISDIDKLNRVKQLLELTDQGALDLAITILRVNNKRVS